MFFRAMLDAMDAWATNGKRPPASRIPTRADNTLVDYATWREQFPAIPGVMPLACPESRCRCWISGRTPTRASCRSRRHWCMAATIRMGLGLHYTVLVPSVDRDGNDVPGVRAPMVAAPLGTYTGWNPRAHGYGHGDAMALRRQLHSVPGNALGTRGDRRSAALDFGTLSHQTGVSGSDRRRRAGTSGPGIRCWKRTWRGVRKWRRTGAGRDIP